MDKAIELGSCLYAIVGASLVAWGIWRAWTRPQKSDDAPPAPQPAPARWSIGAELRRLFLVEDVSDYVHGAPVVMSREQPSEAAYAASVLSTDAVRTPYVPTPAKPKAEDYLTLCKLMRASGIKRDDALAAFKACGIPFNSGVWADAAPPADAPEHVTPIAGRPTDAEFPYQPL